MTAKLLRVRSSQVAHLGVFVYLVFAVSMPVNAKTIRIATMNAQFNWDHREPHDGMFFKHREAPTQAAYEAKNAAITL